MAMSYSDRRYWIHFREKGGLYITHAGMTWESYHTLASSLIARDIRYTHGCEERSEVSDLAQPSDGTDVGQMSGKSRHISAV
jgi:hypothetical protein